MHIWQRSISILSSIQMRKKFTYILISTLVLLLLIGLFYYMNGLKKNFFFNGFAAEISKEWNVNVKDETESYAQIAFTNENMAEVDLVMYSFYPGQEMGKDKPEYERYFEFIEETLFFNIEIQNDFDVYSFYTQSTAEENYLFSSTTVEIEVAEGVFLPYTNSPLRQHGGDDYFKYRTDLMGYDYSEFMLKIPRNVSKEKYESILDSFEKLLENIHNASD